MMKPSITDLKPCPFCGSKAVIERCEMSQPELPEPWWIVQCVRDTLKYRKKDRGCPGCAMAIGDTEAEAREKWNTRSPGKVVQS